MIAEAVDTVLALGWALAAWIVGLALAAGQLKPRLAPGGPWRGSGAPEPASRGSRVAEGAERAADGRVANRAPLGRASVVEEAL